MARALAVFFGAGGALVLLTLVLPHAEDANELGVAIPPIIAFVVTGVLLGLGSRASVLTLQIFLFGGSLLITGVILYGGSGAVLYPVLYLLVSSYAFFFLRLRLALIQVGASGALYGLLLLFTDDTRLEAGMWVMVVGTVTIGGLLVGRMVAAVRAQAADVAAVSQMAGGTDVTKALRATCEGVVASLGADVAIMLRPAEGGGGLTVEAMAGSAESGQVFGGDAARLALERAFTRGEVAEMESDELPRGLHRFDGVKLGLAQPVLRDGEVVAVLAVAWTSTRRSLPDRTRPVALLFAAEASLTLERAAEVALDRERQALEINDNIVQGLVVAKYSAQRGNVDGAIEAIEDTLVRARKLISAQLSDVHEGRGLQPGDLARREAAGVPQSGLPASE
ncbi:MAG: hypothetical protein H0V81_16360 [Solirubrobacterales bacterium]|nr:hypothetical protein [Solirubrobacterales bacterium]